MISEREVLYEHRFWLQILGDHSRFIFDNLSPDEKVKVDKAEQFIKIFDELLEIARRIDERGVLDLTRKALPYAEELRDFKLLLIKEHLIGKIKIQLPPTFINHMVNEIEEYIYIMKAALAREHYAITPFGLHLLWLPDASGHAGAVLCGLDSTEDKLRKLSEDFVKEFEQLYIKSVEYKGYTRTGLKEFPALSRLNSQVDDKITLFMKFLKEVEDLRMTKKALGTLLPLLTDHMYREECYYLNKLGKVSAIRPPECDPTKPRLKL